ncbi:helix-turn-helix domain-containing protein [Acetobacter sp. LMG 1636]|uniref:Helix-turn-helix domain-containing protein n=2 Tax=Acetobacter fallax TaxID=1737473 RepID=A0ABX0K6X7_9PROT|nr:helix-turn-helix domain-containing protein [Acetobacter fallax]NHO35793.1 helix-turn-helix domain-containing protein [Acetobacter fallax]
MPSALSTLRETILRHASEAHTQTTLPGLSLFRTECQTQPVDCIYKPRLCIIVQGSKQVVVGDRIFTYDAEKYLIATVDLPVTGCVTQATPESPYLSLSLDLDPADIASLLLSTGATPPETHTAPGLAVSTLTEDLLCPMARLTTLLDTPDDIPVLAPLIKKEVAYRLLQGEQGALLRQIALADSYLSQISRAIAWIRDHYARAFDIDTVAKIAGMSTPSFYRHFRAVTMMSPLQYRTRIRLQEARKRLLTDGEDAAEAGFAVGYESPSQFSRDYRRLFGSPPARDAARLRATTAPELSGIPADL